MTIETKTKIIKAFKTFLWSLLAQIIAFSLMYLNNEILANIEMPPEAAAFLGIIIQGITKHLNTKKV
jgi:hypothetical protein